MTIVEYLMSEITYAKNAMVGNYDREELNHYQSYIDAMMGVLYMLPKLEHDVTLKEIKEMCQSYIDIGGCMKCPLNKNSYAYNCIAVGMPSRLEPDAIQRCMKEARND